ncbi:MAG: LysM peptidoglycan-binding domain-containing protein [Pseudomonadota bacterium]
MTFRTLRCGLLAGTALVMAACSGPLDFDMRGGFGNAPSTADAARTASETANRPVPDDRGVISYPNYQVAVARRGDTIDTVASRVGGNLTQIARFNGLQPGDALREGEIVALPSRVSEPAGGPIQPGAVDITSLAGSAIDAADGSSGNVTTSTLEPAPQGQPRGVSGVEPVRHRVERGETAFSISRLYQVSVASLADWNGLGSDFSVREGQQLLIPVAVAEPRAAEPADDQIALPGQGSDTPQPPSASTPLPEEDTRPASEPVETIAAPDLSSQQPATGSARMILPVDGAIVREYSAGRSDGISISGSPGGSVKAAAPGTVAAITEDTNGVPIIVVKHDGNLLTVYSNIDNVAVRKGQSVSRGAKLAEIRSDGSSAVNFEVREGFDSVDPAPYLN